MIHLDEELENCIEQIDCKPDSTDTGKNEKNFYFKLSNELRYLVGHFPKLSVLPAVGLIDISDYLIQRHYFNGKHKLYNEIPLLKLLSPTFPDQVYKIIILQNLNHQFHIQWLKITDLAETTCADLKIFY